MIKQKDFVSFENVKVVSKTTDYRILCNQRREMLNDFFHYKHLKLYCLEDVIKSLNEEVKKIFKFPLKMTGYEISDYKPIVYYSDKEGGKLKIEYTSLLTIHVEREYKNTIVMTDYKLNQTGDMTFIQQDHQISIKYSDRRICYSLIKNNNCQYFAVKFDDSDMEYRFSKENTPIESAINFVLSLESKNYTAKELYFHLTNFFKEEFKDVRITLTKPMGDYEKFYSYELDKSNIKGRYAKEKGILIEFSETFKNGDILFARLDNVYSNRKFWRYMSNNNVVINYQEKEYTKDILSISKDLFFNGDFSEIRKNLDEHLEKILSYLGT